MRQMDGVIRVWGGDETWKFTFQEQITQKNGRHIQRSSEGKKGKFGRKEGHTLAQLSSVIYKAVK